MRFTIVTPSFNQLDWLELCIASVADQGRKRAEAGNLSLSEGKVNEWEGEKVGAERSEPEAKPEIGRCGDQTDWSEATAARRDRRRARSTWEGGSRAETEKIFIEHLVCDGGSEGIDDFKGRMLARFPEIPHYRLEFLVGPDEGMYDAINKGLRRATGDICSYLNCDEQYLPEALATVGNYFGKHTGTDVLFGDTIVAGREGEPLCYWRPYVPTLKHLAGSTLNTLTCSTFFRRSVVEAGHFFEPQWKVVGDLQWIRGLVAKQRSMVCLRAPLAVFTFLGDNLGASAKAHEEFGASREASSGLQRAMRRGWHGVRKLFSGAYVQRKVTYDLFALSDPSRRRRYTCPSLGWKWPGLAKT